MTQRQCGIGSDHTLSLPKQQDDKSTIYGQNVGNRYYNNKRKSHVGLFTVLATGCYTLALMSGTATAVPIANSIESHTDITGALDSLVTESMESLAQVSVSLTADVENLEQGLYMGHEGDLESKEKATSTSEVNEELA